MTNRVAFFKAKQSPRLQVWSNWLTWEGETATMLTLEVTTLIMNDPSIPLVGPSA
jgi:hypothetical protein